MRRITAVIAKEGSKLICTYENGHSITFDVSPLIQRKGVFEKLLDPTEFQKVRLGPRGRSVEWPDGIDLCADAIWLKATGEKESFDDEEKAS